MLNILTFGGKGNKGDVQKIRKELKIANTEHLAKALSIARANPNLMGDTARKIESLVELVNSADAELLGIETKIQ
jgi:hypothetical protein